ncbi:MULTISPECIES: heme-binding protein [unclassified Aeromicrobium]|uniref:heme-binding protein n=1 Tax=unclassified Aeromicrobium TaxID=2633570 RepID=UPI00396B2F93
MRTKTEQLEALRGRFRTVEQAVPGDEDLGPFKLLPGTWSNEPDLAGRGWNMIALPFGPPQGATFRPPYRLLMNQYNEKLTFSLVDKAVPNRGIAPAAGGLTPNADQLLVALDYEQGIKQIVSEDFPSTSLTGAPDTAIHHEPGLFLSMTDPLDEDVVDIARLATIPHGDSVLGLGVATVSDGPPTIPGINALPLGVNQDVDANPYLQPYKHFRDAPFRGLFNPVDSTALLKAANEGVDIVRTTRLEFDSTVATGGISNIPFIVRQANASEMKSTFWIQEVRNADGGIDLRLQYAQVVQLDFFDRFDGGPGRIKWPHVSINTLAKVEDPPAPGPGGYDVMPS